MQWRQQRIRVEDATVAFAKEKAALDFLEQSLIPEAMGEAANITLADGTKLALKTSYHGHITEGNTEAAMQELVLLGRTDLISTEITVRFARDEFSLARDVVSALRRNVPQYPVHVQWADDVGPDLEEHVQTLIRLLAPARTVDVAQKVHSSTLKAFVKQQYALGAVWNADVFGAFEKRIAVVTPP